MNLARQRCGLIPNIAKYIYNVKNFVMCLYDYKKYSQSLWRINTRNCDWKLFI